MIHLALAFATTVYIAWSIGANDETMATAAGSGLFSVDSVVLLGAFMDFLGAVFLGGEVESTLMRLVPEGGLAGSREVGLIVILMSTATWLSAVSLLGWPVSTTHSAVGAAVGLGLFSGGVEAVPWEVLWKVVSAWAISPLLGLVGAFLIYLLMDRVALRRARGLRAREKIEWASAVLVLAWAALTSLSRGGNDIGNATAFLSPLVGDPLLTRTVAGAGMAVGLVMVGRRVVKTVGNELVYMSPSMALAAQSATALVLTGSTLLGLPVSGTHVLVAAMVGVALAKRARVNPGGLQGILFAWVVTVPGAALVAYGLAAVTLLLL